MLTAKLLLVLLPIFHGAYADSIVYGIAEDVMDDFIGVSTLALETLKGDNPGTAANLAECNYKCGSRESCVAYTYNSTTDQCVLRFCSTYKGDGTRPNASGIYFLRWPWAQDPDWSTVSLDKDEFSVIQRDALSNASSSCYRRAVKAKGTRLYLTIVGASPTYFLATAPGLNSTFLGYMGSRTGVSAVCDDSTCARPLCTDASNQSCGNTKKQLGIVASQACCGATVPVYSMRIKDSANSFYTTNLSLAMSVLDDEFDAWQSSSDAVFYLWE